MLSKKVNILFWLFFLLSITAVGALYFSFEFLPLQDLPHHIAQTALWKAYISGDNVVADNFSVNWLKPYALAYFLPLILSYLVEIHTAFSIMLFASHFGLFFAFWWILRLYQKDQWWALLAIPLGFGHAFHWGFAAFHLSITLSIFTLIGLRKFCDTPSRGNFVFTFLFGTLSLATHVMAVAFIFPAGAGILLNYWSRKTVRQLFFVGVIVSAITASGIINFYGLDVLGSLEYKNNLQRVLHLFGSAFEIAYSSDAQKIGAGIVLIFILLCRWQGRLKAWRDWLPLIFSLPLLFLTKQFVGHLYPFYDRFGIIIVILLLIALSPSEKIWKRLALRFVVALVVLISPLYNYSRFKLFNQEMEAFMPLLKKVPRYHSLLLLNYSPFCDNFPVCPLLSANAYHTMLNLGRPDCLLFAQGQIIKPDSLSKWRRCSGVAASPDRFDWNTDCDFDYYLEHRYIGEKTPFTELISKGFLELIDKGAQSALYKNNAPHNIRISCTRG